jgi:hypothetical protein
MQKLKHREAKRIYHYPDGSKSEFNDITEVGVTKSGFHKLTSESQGKFIVAPGWRYIELDVAEWTF